MNTNSIKKLVNEVIYIYNLFKNSIKNLLLIILNGCDLLGIVYTYIGLLISSFLILTSFIEENYIKSLVGCVVAYSLIYINKNIKGGK